MNRNKTPKFLALIALTATLSACVSTKTITKNQVADTQLLCSSVATRIGEVRGARDYARSNKGISGSNVAAALFFWPALLVNNSNTTKMIESMNEREAVLSGLYDGKNCSDTIPSYEVKEMKKKFKSGDTQESFG